MGNMFSPSFEAREQSLKKRKEEINSRRNKLSLNEGKWKANKESLQTNIQQYTQKKQGEIGPAMDKIKQHQKLLTRLPGGGGGGGRTYGTYSNNLERGLRGFRE
jgi:hypothetical protein